VRLRPHGKLSIAMPPRHLNDAKHWHDRAAKMRLLADGYADKKAAGIMHHLADDYDKLGDRAADRARRDDGTISPSPIPKPQREK
jgi:hypothetical protein